MFNLFTKSVYDMEDEDLMMLIINSQRIEGLAKKLISLIKEAKKKNARKSRTRSDAHHDDIEIRTLLRAILMLLHMEDAEAKKAVKDELAIERGPIGAMEMINLQN